MSDSQSNKDRYHAVVIGAGHNGLVAALRMAQAGLKVVVVEAREVVGGLCAVESFHPGYAAPGPLHETATLRSEVAKGLGLLNAGLRFKEQSAPTVVPVADGTSFSFHRETPLSIAALKTLAPKAATGYAEWAGFVDRMRPLLQAVLSAEPPPMMVRSMDDMWALGKRGLALRKLGKDDMLELMRVAPMCAADWLGENFESEPLKAALALPGVLSTYYGPWSAGSATTLLAHLCTAEREVEGGVVALMKALETQLEVAGVDIRTSAKVARINVSGQTATGVTLDDGSVLHASVVASACDPRKTFLELIDPLHVPIELEDQVSVFRCRGTVAKVNLALSGPIDLPDRPGHDIEYLRIAGDTIDDLERAFDPVKYGELPSAPALDVRVPSIGSPELAPEGHHVASIVAGFYPYHLRSGWTDEVRDSIGDTIVSRLERYAPGISDKIVAREVLTPVDIETRYGVTGGHIHHGEHALDQLLFMRPGPSLSRYATPISGLFLCGSGSHPGGGVTGAPGWLGAGAVLASRD